VSCIANYQSVVFKHQALVDTEARWLLRSCIVIDDAMHERMRKLR